VKKAEDDHGRRHARLYLDYQRSLQAYTPWTSMTSSRAGHLLDSDAEARDKWQARLRYLLVDEYQDTNAAQYRLLKLLAGNRAASPQWAMTTNPSIPGAARSRRTCPCSRKIFPR